MTAFLPAVEKRLDCRTDPVAGTFAAAAAAGVKVAAVDIG
jgi:hypothetical protein